MVDLTTEYRRIYLLQISTGSGQLLVFSKIVVFLRRKHFWSKKVLKCYSLVAAPFPL
jgi:hypothetical protein